ncbi:hypothetical protein GC105_13590 [Alkalibaculum sp. M08DMB]|uniref:Uncharacterized protein n=1 Tax=Alkalibaculum sporogenes TaxID=2655001 RepID=A0A6A7KBT6_9FIRM|nr:hypothetical protein [Alkalibaculum sporogenes]MPW26815.1 hypothetical protein [Alkalibaculum sporogenes]
MKFKKADEMEISINFKSMRLSSTFVNIALIIWLAVDFINSGKLPFILFSIVCIQNIIFFGSKLYMTNKLSVM